VSPRILVIIACLAVGGGLTFWLWPRTATDAKPAGPTTATVERGPLKEVLTATGTVVPRTQVAITCKASGRVVELPVQVSSTVQKGDLLFTLDPEEERRRVARAQVELESAQARAEQARLALAHETESLAVERARDEAELASAEVAANDAAERAGRMHTLQAKGLTSQEEVTASEVQAASARANLESLRLSLRALDARARLLESKRQDVTLAESDVKTQRLNLGDAQERLSDTRVMSPIAGTVTTVNIEIGQLIASAISTVGAAGTPVITVVDMSTLQVRVNALEMDIGRIRLGQHAEVVTDALPGRVFTGTVSRIAAAGVRPKTGSDQSVTFEVLVTLDPTDLPLRPEMTASIELTTLEAKDTLLIPVEAVHRQGLKTSLVIVAADGTKETRTVELGGTDGVKQQVLSGVKEGERVEIGQGVSRWRNDFQVGI
jgi:HlyD family secretion protein